MSKKGKDIWTYYFARKFSTSRFELVMRVYFSEFYKKHFSARLKNGLVKPGPGMNHSIYYIDSEWQRFADKVYRVSCYDWSRFKYYIDLIKKTQKYSLLVTKKIINQPLINLSWKKIGTLWAQWDRAHLEHFLKPIWIPFIIEPLLANDAKIVLEQLIKKRGLQKQESEYLEIVFGPDYPNAIVSERLDLIKLAIAVRTGSLRGKKLVEKIKQHTFKYAFIPCYDVIDTPWDESYFKRNLKNLLKENLNKLRYDLNNTISSYPARRLAFKQVLKKLRPTKKDKDLLQMIHIIAFIKDERDDYRRRLSYTIQPLFKEMARRYKLPFRAPLYLIKSEMEKWFSTGKLSVSLGELKQRLFGYCLAYINGGPIEVMSGQKIKKYLASQKFSQIDDTKTEVVGMVGNRGIASGPACIIRTKHDLRKVVDGDILVAVTTSPDYVPTMRRCRAFVTDEGGITSHAAIVARELGLPCVVGTKNATEIFKDDEVIEVDANHGIVRLI